jgi:hypothetical protein
MDARLVFTSISFFMEYFIDAILARMSEMKREIDDFINMPRQNVRLRKSYPFKCLIGGLPL